MGKSIRPWQHLYSAAWSRARAAYLLENPTCRMCQQLGRLTAATVVDHIIPHKGNEELFWDTANWQPMCKPCHDSHKQHQERTGHVRGCDETGMPLDPSHHWRGP